MINKLFDINNKLISRLSFIFLAYATIAGGHVAMLLPCEIQYSLENNIYIKHLAGIMLIFCFIMMTGGWDSDDDKNTDSRLDWSNGNTLHTLLFTIVMYIVFLLTSKMTITMNMILYGLLFIIYVINTYVRHLDNKNKISDSSKVNITYIIKILLSISLIVFITGIIGYYNYEKNSYGKEFSLYKFLMGTKKCHSLE
tara:strand:- start:414 stop:1004 length:591 start_codon:yes stop_codon:yes gene_type:complete